MKSGFRQMVGSVTSKLQEKDPDNVKAEAVIANANHVNESLQRYCATYSAYNMNTKELYTLLKEFYPSSGPLSSALSTLQIAALWGEPATSSKAEMIRSQLSVPAQGIANMAQTIIENIASRNKVGLEREHYLGKVGRLTQEAAENPSKKSRLTENQTKLASVMSEHSELVTKIQEASSALDADMIAVLTPTIMQMLRMQLAYFEDASEVLRTAISSVPVDANNRPLMTAPPPSQKLAKPGILEASTSNMSSSTPRATTTSTSRGIDGKVHSEADKSVASGASVASLITAAAANPTSTTPSKASTAGRAGSSVSKGSTMPGPSVTTPTVAPTLSTPASVASGSGTAISNAAVAGSIQKSSVDKVNGHGFNDLYVCEADFEAQAEGDVSLVAGDMILVIKRDDSGWWECRISDEFGVCPSNYIANAVLDQSYQPKGTSSVEAHDPRVRFQAVAKAQYAYAADDDSEMTLAEGDEVYLFSDPFDGSSDKAASTKRIIESGWVLATRGGLVDDIKEVGFVPLSYLKKVRSIGLGEKVFSSTNKTTSVTKPPSTTSTKPTANSSISTVVTSEASTQGLKKQSPSPNVISAAGAASVSSAPMKHVQVMSTVPSVAGSDVITSSSSSEGKSKPLPKQDKQVISDSRENRDSSASSFSGRVPMPTTSKVPMMSGSGGMSANRNFDDFYNSPAFESYRKMYKLGLPTPQIKNKASLDGVDPTSIPDEVDADRVAASVAGSSVTGAQIESSQPTIAKPPESKSTSKGGFFSFGKGKNASPPSTTTTTTTSTSSKKSSSQPPKLGGAVPEGAARSAMLSGIEGFNKKALKHTEVEEKPSIITGAGLHVNPPAVPQRKSSVGNTPFVRSSGGSMMDELQARQARMKGNK